MPVFALGGVDVERARAAAGVGARVACIGAVLGRPDAGAAARALAAAIG
jgi:thiamine monophosphate synthase